MNFEQVVDSYYNEWNDFNNVHPGNYLTYANVVKRAAVIDQRHEFALLINSYDSQVCNGGHDQYMVNGYAGDGVGGFFAKHPTTEFHDRLIELMRVYGFSKEPVYHIMTMFHVSATSPCYSCDGSGIVVEEDEDGDEYETDCWECHGTGSIDEPSLDCDGDAMDSLYYDLRDAFMSKIKSWFETQE